MRGSLIVRLIMTLSYFLCFGSLRVGSVLIWGFFISNLVFVRSCWVGLMGSNGGGGRLDVDGKGGQPWKVLQGV